MSRLLHFFSFPAWIKHVKTITGLTVLCGIGFLAFKLSNILIDSILQVNVIWLCYAYWFWIVAFFLSALLTKQCLKASKNSLPLPILFRVNARRIFDRYRFIRSALMVGRSHDLMHYGIEPQCISTTYYMENAFLISAASILGGFVMVCYKGLLDLFGLLGLISIFSGLVWLVLVPLMFKMRATKFVSVDEERYFVALFVSMVVVSVQSLSFYCYARAFSVGLTHPPLEIMGGYALAWMFGSITFCVPLGLGVFEVLLSAMIFADTSLCIMIVFVAGFRLIQLTGDLFVHFLYQLTRLRKQRF